MQVNNNYVPGYGGYPYPPSSPPPVTYTPYVPQPYGYDQYRPGYTIPPQNNQGGFSSLFSSSNNKPYVTKQSVAFGLAGACIGWFCGGPMGALIGGLIGLVLGILMNIINMWKADSAAKEARKQQQIAIQNGNPWYNQNQVVQYNSPWQNSQNAYMNQSMYMMQQGYK